jgi:hypothetical protein
MDKWRRKNYGYKGCKRNTPISDFIVALLHLKVLAVM